MYEVAKAHFKKSDPRLYAAAVEIELIEITPSQDLFRDIVWTIVGQQLSSRAADAIFARLLGVIGNDTVEPIRLLQLSPEELRAAGLSGAKGRAVQAFSNAVQAGEIDLTRLPY